MKLNLLFLLIFLTTVLSCRGQRRIPDGGSCSYQHADYPAVILDTISHMHQVYDLMIYRGDHFNDTVFYSHINNGRLVNTTLRDLHLNLGDTIYYRQSHIIDGSCSPWVDMFRLEKYRMRN